MTSLVTKKDDPYKYWMNELEAEAEDSKDWRDKSKKIIKQYRAENDAEDGEFNILWSNTETIHSVLFSNKPKPNVTRRFKDPNPVARKGAEVLERGLEYSTDQYDFNSLIDGVVNDCLLPGAGTVRIRYKPYYEDQEPINHPVEAHDDINDEGQVTGQRFYSNGQELSESEITVDDEGNYTYIEQPEPVVVYEETTSESVEWDNLRWDRSVKSWDKINWADIDHYLNREELVEQFGKKIGERIELTFGKVEGSSEPSLALVHEIFDIKTRTIYIISPGLKNEVIAEWEDPLGISGFLPFPKPFFATLTSDRLEPIPDYLFYQEQALELNNVSSRIAKLVDALKVRGVYDDEFAELADVATANDNEMVPINKLTAKLKGGNIDDVLKFMPLNEIIVALQQLYRQREEIKQTIYEITGISDIVRGQSNPNETATAQQIKQSYAGMRVARRQTKLQEFIREVFRIKAEIMAEHFSEETLSMMTGIEVNPQIMQMLRSDVLRTYNITIETDSTIQQDQSQEKRDRAEVVKSIAALVREYLPAIQTGVITQDVFKEILMFSVRAFKGSRTLEDAFEQMEVGQPQQPGQPPGQPPGQSQGRPDPRQLAAMLQSNNVVPLRK